MSEAARQSVKDVSSLASMLPDRLAGSVDTLAPEGLARNRIAEGRSSPESSHPSAEQPQGLMLGGYLVLHEIGRGGMGRVYKAEHRRMKRTVAIKVLAAASQSPKAVLRFQREVQAAARLNHPNIVAAYDADEHDGMHYLVMEYVEGNSLAECIQQRPLDVPTALNYILQAARALQYAHGQGIVHRDIKPANLLLTPAGLVKVLDMGLARFADEPDNGQTFDGQKLTQAGQIMGTADFMSPEQAEDTHQADARSDIYSLGCTMYFLLVGRPPYTGDSVLRKLLAHREQPIPEISQQRTDAPRQLDGVFRRMLAKRPADRYASMAEVIAALEVCASAVEDRLKSDFGNGSSTKLPRFRADSPYKPPSDSGVLAGLEYAPDSWPIADEELMLKEDAERLDAKLPKPGGPGTLIKLVCCCGQKFAVKTEYAGKRVKCRGCQEILSVPGAEMAVYPLQCKKCGKRLTASIKLAGQKVKCTQCPAVLKVPSDAPASSGSAMVSQSKTSTTATTRVIACRCGKHLKIGPELAGKTGKCPFCGTSLKV